jgi:hypothetical protein
MKSLLLVGGLLGFGIGMGCGIMQGDSVGSILWHGCLAAYVMAMLLAWWGRTWRKNHHEALHERENSTLPSLPAVTLPKASKT